MMSEQHTFTGQPVNIWRGEFLLSVTTKVAIAKVVGKYEDNVWRCLITLQLAAADGSKW